MGRQRKILPPRSLFAVADTQEEVDALLDVLQDMAEEMKTKRGRKRRLDHYEVAFTATKALPPEAKLKRHSYQKRAALPQDRIGRTPVRTKGGIELAGFNPDDDDPKDCKYDMRGALALQHALAWQGERVTITNAVKILQRARALPGRAP